MKIYDFFIANLGIRLEVPWSLPDSPRFSPFLKEALHPEIRITLSLEEGLSPLPEEGIGNGVTFCTHQRGERVCYHLQDGQSFALTEYGEDYVRLRIKRGFEHYFSTFSAIFNRIDFENLLTRYDRLLLHASLCEKDGKAILFAGASGAGKSTQAQLWERFRFWSVINGDRVVLEKTPKGFLAHGSPWAGSSQIYENKKGHVLLTALPVQALTNSARLVDRGEAFQRIFPHIALERWDGAAVERAMALCDDFVAAVPVYHLNCRADEGAVSCLEEVLP